MIPLNISTLMERIQAACSQKTKNEKQVRLKGYQKVMMAATFAEAGETDTAKAYMDNPGKPSENSNSKGDRNGG